MSLAGILFDKDGTLVDFDATWGRATHTVMAVMSGDDPAVYAKLATSLHFISEECRFLPTSPMIAGSTADYAPLWAEALNRVCDIALSEEIDRRLGVEGLENLMAIGEPVALFAALHAGGMRLGVATNDAEANARKQAEKLGLLPFLDFIAGYDSGHGGKPGPGMVTAFARCVGVEPHRTALVGDSIHDLEAARAAGALGIAVLSGPASRSLLEPHADHVIDSIADLPALLDRLVAGDFGARGP